MKTKPEINADRERLLAMLRRIGRDETQLRDEALQAAGGEASGSLSDVPLHLADLGSHAMEQEITLDLLENEQQLVGEITAALERIEQGGYGLCEACRKKIPRGRLQVLPYARYCIACARSLLEPNEYQRREQTP